MCWPGTVERAGLLATGEALDETVEGCRDSRLVEPIVDLAASFADAKQAGAAKDPQVVRHGRAAERHAFGDLADVKLTARQHLHEVLARRIGERSEDLATGDEVVAQRADLRIERVRVAEAAGVLGVDNGDRLKHVNILLCCGTGG